MGERAQGGWKMAVEFEAGEESGANRYDRRELGLLKL